MSEIKKIISKILILLFGILLFAFSIIRQIVLPNKRRKGNILSSLFIFFTGTIERLISFEHGFFKMAAIFKLKYCRQGVIIIGALLFLLSSFEWAAGSNISAKLTGYSEHLSQVFEKRIKVVVKRQPPFYLKITFLSKKSSVYISIFHRYVLPSSLIRIFLLTRSLRI